MTPHNYTNLNLTHQPTGIVNSSLSYSDWFFFIGDDKPNLSYTEGKGAGLKRSRNKSEEIEPSPDQTNAEHIRLNFLETSHRNVAFFMEGRV